MDSDRRHPTRPARDDHVEATAFLHEIVMTADSLREARAFDGELAISTQPRGCCARASVAAERRRSRISGACSACRGKPRGHALRAASAGVVELFQAPDDRRAWQVALTPSGRAELERQRKPQIAWIFTLLNGLEPSPMRTTRHVLHVMRQRLERYENDLRAAKRSLVSAAAARR